MAENGGGGGGGRQIKTMLSGVLVALTESLPLGILQILYSQRLTSKLGTMDVLSLVTSWYGLSFSTVLAMTAVI